MDLYSKCEKCGEKIDETNRDESRGYPKAAITLLKEDGRVKNVDLCWKCRRAFVEWMKGADTHEPGIS